VFDAAAHRNARHLIVEFETASPPAGNEAPIYSLGRVFLPQLQQADTVSPLAALAAREMKRSPASAAAWSTASTPTATARCWPSEIDPGYDSYTGHRFPASDVPRRRARCTW
jgi:chemotaxis family two-component system sensor kinase Cph1